MIECKFRQSGSNRRLTMRGADRAYRRWIVPALVSAGRRSREVGSEKSALRLTLIVSADAPLRSAPALTERL